MPNRVAITGMGAVCSLGSNLAEIAVNMYEDGPPPIAANALNPQALPLPFFHANLEERHHSARDTFNLAKQSASEALEMAGWTDLHGCAVIVGTTSGTALHFLGSHTTGTPRQDLTDYLEYNTAIAIGREFGATDSCFTISNACISGTDAIGLGMDMLNSGRTERVLCGGADAFSLIAHTGFARLKIYDPESCRPFDYKRNGLNQGEGAAFFCLEKSASKTIGHVIGYGAYSDAWHLTTPHPEGRGLKKAINAAVSQSGRNIDEFAFINAHGTGTRTNDAVEGKVLLAAAPNIPIWASKGATGHTLGAAGALEAALTLLALSKQTLPVSVGFSQIDPEIGVYPNFKRRLLSKKTAISVSLGFGGGNSALILEVD